MTGSRKKLTILFCILMAFCRSPMVVAGESEFTSKQKSEINQMIRAYILENPDILPEAIQILQNRSQRAVLTQNHARLYEDGFSFVDGNKNGDVTIIEFFDYNCGYCKRAFSTVEKLMQNDSNIRIIYKEFPILSDTSYTASKAAMASMKQGKYNIFRKALLKNSGSLTEDRIFEIARKVGLDDKILAKDMTSPVFERNIQINHALAKSLRITGTPGFVIGEAIIPGAVPYDDLVMAVEKARIEQAKKSN